MEGAIERAQPNEISQQNALSRLRLPLEKMQIFAANLNFKSFIILWQLAIGRKILGISYSLRTLYNHIKINRFGNLQLDTVPRKMTGTSPFPSFLVKNQWLTFQFSEKLVITRNVGFSNHKRIHWCTTVGTF